MSHRRQHVQLTNYPSNLPLLNLYPLLLPILCTNYLFHPQTYKPISTLNSNQFRILVPSLRTDCNCTLKSTKQSLTSHQSKDSLEAPFFFLFLFSFLPKTSAQSTTFEINRYDPNSSGHPYPGPSCAPTPKPNKSRTFTPSVQDGGSEVQSCTCKTDLKFIIYLSLTLMTSP